MGTFEHREKTFSIFMCQIMIRGHEEIPSVGSWKDQPSNDEHSTGWHSREEFMMF